MSALFAGLAVGLLLAGIFGLIVWWKVPAKPATAPTTRRQSRIDPKLLVRIAIGVAIGVVGALLTSMPLLIVAAPLAMVVIPPLLKPADKSKIERSEALAEWTRSVAAGLQTGSGLEQSIRATLKSAPAAIRPQVADLNARLESRMRTDQALRLFAEALDCTLGDTISANLMLAAKRRGPGLAETLNQLAAATAAEVSTLRSIHADREKPRASMRWMIMISLVAWMLLFASEYAAAYRTPTGQLLLIVFLGIYALGIWMWHKMSTVKPDPRFITAPAGDPA